MKGLKIIPMFAGLLILSYLGVLFVRHNPNEVIVRFGGIESPSSALGFVILTSILVGMVISGILCSVELLFLYMQNQKLKRKVGPVDSNPRESVFDSSMDISFDEQEQDLFPQEEEEKESGTPDKPTNQSQVEPNS